MGLFDFLRGKKAGAETSDQGQEDSFIKFDNLTFKLAVIEELMYQQQLIESTGESGDKFFEKYPDYVDTEEDEEIKRLEAWSNEMLAYSEDLKIPANRDL